jgi:hypothetical protein
MKHEPVRLTHFATLPQWLSYLEGKADLSAETWKRLYLVALRRLGKRQSDLATLCAVEAFDLAFTASILLERGDPLRTRERVLEEKLALVEQRKTGRGHVQRLNPHPRALHMLFRQVVRFLETWPPPIPGKPQPGREESWAEIWKTFGQTAKPPAVPTNEKPVNAALAVVATAYQYEPESLRVIFSRRGLPLKKDA